MKRSAEASTSRCKKYKSSRESNEDDGAGAARYVEPFPEAGAAEDAEDAGEAGAAQLEHRIGSWADVEIPEEEEVEEAEEAEGDLETWTKSLQELCRRLQPEVGRGERSEKPSAEELLQRIRAALKSGDWLNITAAVWISRGPDMASAVKQLSAAELVTFSKALVDRYEYPRERLNCERWLAQILEHGSHAVIDSEAFREVVRPLIKTLTEELKPADFGGQVLHCLGKWKMVQRLAEDYRSHHAAKGADEADEADEAEEDDADDADDADAGDEADDGEEDEDED